MEEKTAVKSSRSTLLRLIGTLLTIALMVYLFSQQGWDEISAALKSIAPWRLGAALGLMMVSRLAVSCRWYILLRASGLDISFSESLQITFAGLFASNFLPTTVGGDVVRLAGAIRLKLDGAVCAASLIVDRLVGMAGMAMVVPFGLPAFLAARGLTASQPSITSGLALLPLGGKWNQAWEKGVRLFRRLLSAISLWVRQPRALLAALVYTWVHMLCLFGILYLLFDGMGQNLSPLLIGGLYGLVYFVTLLPFSINGYGLQEVSMTLVFSSLGGASMSSGLTAALLFRTLMMIASLPGALFVPGLLPGGHRKS